MDVRALTTETWTNLAHRSGLSREDWGEGWLQLAHLEDPEESVILAVLRRVAAASAAGRTLCQAAPEAA